jgi:hypothetical protein
VNGAADGQPLRQRPVRMGAGITNGELGLAIFTLGLSCTTGGCSGRTFDTTTDANGAYSFTLKGSDTQSLLGEAVDEAVVATGAPGPQQVSGASTAATFRVQVNDVHLPVLDLVDPGLTIASAAAIDAHWSTPQPGPYDLTFETTATTPIWRVTTLESGATIDRRVLEDSSGRVVVSGSKEDAVAGSTVDIRWRSPALGFVGAGAAPPSRGRPCHFLSTSGTALDASTCALTDGNLVRADALASVCPTPTSQGTACEAAASVDIALRDPTPAELVVVRGCTDTCAVAVSTDGTTFAPAGAVTGDFGTLALDGASVVAVRVSITPTTHLREVSVWGPLPPASPAADASSPSAVDRVRSAFGIGGHSHSSRTVLAIVAAVIAALVLAAIGFVLGRRRSATSTRGA